ncbi:MAG: 50S ribosomal protein L22 [Candidatus Vogelbacteria bacterium]|nr:50S ribosomal protein L22 [Candidatus Vogelbacteria bacterium]
MKAQLNNYRQSPRKVRLAADLVRGQTVDEALRRLKFLPKRAARPLQKLIKSALDNTPGAGELMVKKISVDAGVVFKRFRAGARGRAFPLKKRTSRVSVVLEAKKLQATS